LGATPEKSLQDAGSQPKRVAIVDDEDDLVMVYSMMVRRCGHRVEFTANDGTPVVQAFADNAIHPDVILMDYRLKSMNGLEVARTIRSANSSVWIVIMSAYESAKREVVGAGFAFIEKPFSLVQLNDVLAGLQQN
jgi:CheY-like chemotaxis protein